ncbi:MAG: two-component system response regulator [Pelagibacteraceae bacterium BACL5 MAG-121128-bin54]|jgi:two-component system, NtrC family, nitrogen regulation response regulator NtrX|nr:MAG: two-component system response regulator [Pelagibacteraceae bacterium BACL5 MAG-121128-bin54]
MISEILIVDDNSDIRNIINDLIIEAGYKTRVAANFNQAIYEIDKKLPDVAIFDVKLDKGDNDGIELLSYLKSKNTDIPVIVISGHANIEMAVKSLKHGAFEFIEKPFDQERLLNFIRRAVENYNLKIENKEYENKLFFSYDLIGESKNITNIKDQIEKISLTESRVIINGPSGTGKELIARKIHKKSKRNNKPFVVINGALLDSDKYELELFGEEKSNGSISFGALEKANKGTLLIDQLSEIPLNIQSKILRVLIDQKFKRLNGNTDINVDVRIICSSSKDLKKEIEIGNFREDLFHRLNVFEINIDPLNNRISDIPLLIKYFSKKISQNYNIKELNIDENDSYILNHDWYGNVRELRNLIERIAILQPDSREKISNIIKESLKTENFNDKITENSLSVPLKEAREKFEKEYLTMQLKKFNGNISKTANFVGMERSALHRKLKGLGIKEFN